ncbi:hypothetical protein G6F58_013429 [Rhizopus delemar]|nr:hypothetical protein G6F58_013429 [Rhizopus delemar]
MPGARRIAAASIYSTCYIYEPLLFYAPARAPSPPFLPQGRRPHARCHPALPSAAPDRRHRPDPAAACTGRLTEADRTGPRAGQGQYCHPQRTPAVGRAHPHRGPAQGRHRTACGHRLLARRRTDQRTDR